MNAVAVGALVVVAVVTVLWTILLIPALLELRRASWRLQEFIRTLELELRPAMQEGRQAIRAATQAAQTASEGAARLRGAMAAVEEASGNLRATTAVLRAVFGSRLIPVASVLAGVRVGMKTLVKRFGQRRESS